MASIKEKVSQFVKSKLDKFRNDRVVSPVTNPNYQNTRSTRTPVDVSPDLTLGQRFWTSRAGENLANWQKFFQEDGTGKLFETLKPTPVLDSRISPSGSVYTDAAKRGLLDVAKNISSIPEGGFQTTRGIQTKDLSQVGKGLTKIGTGGLTAATLVSPYRLAKAIPYVGISGAVGGVSQLFNQKDKALQEGIVSSLESLGKAVPFAGITSVTEPLMKGLPLAGKVGANVLEGLAIDRATGMETTPTSVAIDALFPIGSAVTGKLFKNLPDDIEINLNVTEKKILSKAKEIKNMGSGIVETVIGGAKKYRDVLNGRWVKKSTAQELLTPKTIDPEFRRIASGFSDKSFNKFIKNWGDQFNIDKKTARTWFDTVQKEKPRTVEFRDMGDGNLKGFDQYGKPMSGTGIEKKLEDPLIQEARKYKSAEEFVKSQGSPLLHGTGNKFNDFDLSKRGLNEKDFQSQNSIFFTDSMDTAKSYGNNIQERYGRFRNPLEVDAEGQMYGDFRDELSDLVRKAKKEGNDVVIVKNLSDRKDWGNYEPATHYAVLDVDSLKTKQQLIDIWNQANRKTQELPKMALGGLAGFEPELDENGNPTGGYTYDPIKGAVGTIAMAGITKTNFDIKDITNSKKFFDDDMFSTKRIKEALNKINSKNMGEVRMDDRDFAESVIKGIDLENMELKSSKNFIQNSKEFINRIFAPVKNLPEDLQNAHRNFWAKRMGSIETANQRASKFYNIPEEDGWKLINDIEAGVKSKVSQPIREELDKLFKEANDEGLDVGYLDNYMTHIWEQPFEQVQKAVASLGQQFKFSGPRGFPTYKEGLEFNKQYGQQIFTPKYTHPSQIIGEYVKKLEETKANIEYFKFLKDKKYIVPEKVGRELGYEPVTANFFPKAFAVTGRDRTAISNWYAPRNLSEMLNSQFGRGDSVGGQVASFFNALNGKMQDIVLSGGVGPLNFWTIGQMMKQAYAGLGDIVTFKPLQGIRQGFVSPMKAFFTSFTEGSAKRYFSSNQDLLKEMSEEGITLSRIGNYTDQFTNVLKKQSVSEKAGKAWNKFFNEPTFKRFMPILQTELYRDIKNTMLSKGLPESEARRLAANTLRNFEGMTNSLAEGRSPVVQDAIGSIFFAPRYRESILNFLNNTRRSIGISSKPGKYLFDPAYNRNRSFVLGTTLMYGVYNLLNRELNGHDMSDNPAGNELHLQIPLKDGSYAYVPLLPSIFYLPRTAIESGMALAKGDVETAKQKLTGVLSQPINLISQVTSNKDFFGNPIYDEEDDTPTRYKKLAGYVVGNTTHPYIREIIAVKQGRKPLYQGIMNMLELPVKFKSAKSMFWNKYYENKSVVEDFKVLAEKDPQKAQEFYSKNSDKIDDFMNQKATVSAYGDMKEYIDNLKSSNADEGLVRSSEGLLNKLFQVQNGQPTKELDLDNPEKTYAKIYGFDKYLEKRPSDDPLKAKAYDQEVLKDARGVFNNKYIPEDMKDKIIEDMGINKVELQADVVAGDDVVNRSIWVRDYIRGLPQEKQAQALSDLINYRTLSGKRILTESVAKELGIQGIYDSYYIKRSSSGRPSGRSIKVPKIKYNKPPTIKAPQTVKPVSISDVISPVSQQKPVISEAELEKFRNPLK